MPEYIPSRPVINVRALLDRQRIVFPPPGLFSYARYALLYYLQHLASLRKRKIQDVLLPDFMCHEVANSLRASGHRPSYYALDHDFQVSPKTIQDMTADGQDCDVILVGHFYGRICRNLREVSRICRERGITVIEDCAHLPFPHHAPFTDDDSDAKLFTLRKVYPVPYGATIVLREGQDRFAQFVRSNVSKRYWHGVGEALGWACKQVIKKGLQVTRRGYTLPYRDISNDPLKPYNFACPGIASLLSTRNCRGAVARRRRNYELYMQHRPVFESWGRVLEFDLDKDVPYMFLLYLEEQYDALTMVQSLMKQSVPAVLGLALDPCVLARLPSYHEYNRIVTLPLHQDLHEGHIRYIAGVLKRG